MAKYYVVNQDDLERIAIDTLDGDGVKATVEAADTSEYPAVVAVIPADAVKRVVLVDEEEATAPVVTRKRPLRAPHIVTVSKQDPDIVVTWAPVEDAEAYDVLIDSTPSVTDVPQSVAPRAAIKGLAASEDPGQFTVRAKRAGKVGPESEPVVAEQAALLPLPAPPVALEDAEPLPKPKKLPSDAPAEVKRASRKKS